MSLLSLIALAIGVATVIAMAFGLPDRWFFGLLALICMVSGAEAAYSELRAWALAFLAPGVLLAAAAVRAALKDARRGGT